MICIKNLNKFCCEDFSLIENYDKAIADTTQTWHCHHRRETDENKTRQQLIEENRYYNVQASELIFMIPAEHISLHFKGKESPLKNREFTEEHKQHLSEANKDNKNWLGKNHSEETKKRQSESRKKYIVEHGFSEETRKKMSESAKKRKSNNKGKHYKISKPRSEEYRKKQSEAQKKAWERRRQLNK